MKLILGACLFILSFHVSADGALILRGRVPASQTVKIEDNKPHLITNTNSKDNSIFMEVSQSKNHTLVSIIQR